MGHLICIHFGYLSNLKLHLVTILKLKFNRWERFLQSFHLEYLWLPKYLQILKMNHKREVFKFSKLTDQRFLQIFIEKLTMELSSISAVRTIIDILRSRHFQKNHEINVQGVPRSMTQRRSGRSSLIFEIICGIYQY